MSRIEGFIHVVVDGLPVYYPETEVLDDEAWSYINDVVKSHLDCPLSLIRGAKGEGSVAISMGPPSPTQKGMYACKNVEGIKIYYPNTWDETSVGPILEEVSEAWRTDGIAVDVAKDIDTGEKSWYTAAEKLW